MILKFKCFALNHLQSGGNQKCSFVNYLDMGESLNFYENEKSRKVRPGSIQKIEIVVLYSMEC